MTIQNDMSFPRMSRINLGAQLPQDAFDILHGKIGVDGVRKQPVQKFPVMMVHRYLILPIIDYRKI